MTRNRIVTRTEHLNFPILKLICLNILTRVQTLVYLSEQKIISIIHSLIVLIRLIALIKVYYALFRHVFFVHALVARLLLKITIIWPNINSISLKASLFNSNLNSIINKNIFCHRDFICIFNYLRNTSVYLCVHLLID